METPLLDIIRVAVKPVWSVYVLINNSKKEIYFGVSKRTFERIMEEHSAGKTKAIAEWNWQHDDIIGDTLYSGLDQYSASKKAHTLEIFYEVLAPEHKVHQTAGI